LLGRVQMYADGEIGIMHDRVGGKTRNKDKRPHRPRPKSALAPRTTRMELAGQDGEVKPTDGANDA